LKLNAIKARVERKTQEIQVRKTEYLQDDEKIKMELFFRYRLFSIFRIIDEKIKSNQMWASTKAKKKPLGPSSIPNFGTENEISYDKIKDDIWKSLKRMASTKSKYKFRDVVNFEKKVQTVMKELFGKRI
jgi:hypothetical protein